MSNALSKIQAEIKAPKGQMNKFGGYKYRSCEDIVEAAKPILNKYGFFLTLTDDIVNIGNRFYVKATATISNGTESFTATSFAREEESKKGMDGSQITGASSSYARKYALNGLFAIDDTKDADATNTHEEENNTTLYNHRELGTKEKPLISNKDFKELCENARNGLLGKIQDAKQKYTFEPTQQKLINQLYSEATKQTA